MKILRTFEQFEEDRLGSKYYQDMMDELLGDANKIIAEYEGDFSGEVVSGSVSETLRRLEEVAADMLLRKDKSYDKVSKLFYEIKNLNDQLEDSYDDGGFPYHEEFKFGGDTPYKRYGKNFIQGLIAKAKKIIPQERIDKFIEDNKEDVEKLASQLSDESGEIDYDKVTEFINKNKKQSISNIKENYSDELDRILMHFYQSQENKQYFFGQNSDINIRFWDKENIGDYFEIKGDVLWYYTPGKKNPNSGLQNKYDSLEILSSFNRRFKTNLKSIKIFNSLSKIIS